MKILIDDFEIDIHGASKGGGYAELLGALMSHPAIGDLINAVIGVIETNAAIDRAEEAIFNAEAEPATAAPPPPIFRQPRARKKPAKRVTKKR